MVELSNLQSPREAIPGKTVTMGIDVSVGLTLGGNLVSVTWDGDAPYMPSTELVEFGHVWFGDKKRVYFSFVMPPTIVKFRVLAEGVKLYQGKTATQYYTITPGKAYLDPEEKPGEFFKSIADFFGEMGSTLLWIVVAFTALVVIGYVVKKKGATGSKAPRP